MSKAGTDSSLEMTFSHTRNQTLMPREGITRDRTMKRIRGIRKEEAIQEGIFTSRLTNNIKSLTTITIIGKILYLVNKSSDRKKIEMRVTPATGLTKEKGLSLNLESSTTPIEDRRAETAIIIVIIIIQEETMNADIIIEKEVILAEEIIVIMIRITIEEVI